MFQMKMTGIDKEFVFRTKSELETQDWMKSIHEHLEHSNGKLLNKTAHGIDTPWKYDNISEA